MKRNTRQREAILTSLHASGRSLSPAEILDEASRYVPNLNLTTVYRQLKGLVEDATVRTVELPAQSTRYEALCFESDAFIDHHHHHFHCQACERVYPIHACPGSVDHLAPKGFRVESHDFTLHGRCADCSRKR